MKEVLKGKDLNEIIAWAAGRLIISIGKGQFQNELSLVIQCVQAEAYERGKKSRKP